MALSSSKATAETVVPSGTQKDLAPDGFLTTNKSETAAALAVKTGGGPPCVPKQAPAVDYGVGNSSAGRVAKQDPTPGRKTGDDSATDKVRDTGIEDNKGADNRPTGPPRRVIDIGALGEDELLGMLRGYINTMLIFAQNTRNVHKELKETLANTHKVMGQYLKAKSQKPSSDTGSKVVKSKSTETHAVEALHPREAASTNTTPITCSSNAIIMDIAEELRALRKEVSEMQSANERRQIHSQPASNESNFLGVYTTTQKTMAASDTDTTPWTEVVSKKSKKTNARTTLDTDAAVEANREPVRPPRKPRDAAALVRKRTPKTEAITISAPREGETYATVMKRVTQEVNLSELGVEVIKTRKTKSGAVLLEVGNSEDAEKLVDRMRQVIGADAKIGRPTRRTTSLLLGVPEWMSPEDITRDVLMADENLSEANIMVRNNSGGGRVVRLEVSMATALRLSEKKTVQIGWSRCRVKLLEPKIRKCFNCLGAGHIAAACPEQATQTKRCFRCRQIGHVIKDCTGVKQGKSPTTKPEENAGENPVLRPTPTK